MAWATPTVTEFKEYFNRDFNYAPEDDSDDLNFILDSDITKAINEATAFFNQSLGYGTDAATTIAFLYLAAFYLVWNLQNSAQGISAQFNFPVSSKSAGGVSVSYQIPDRFQKNATVAMFAQNGYGMKYLSLSLPLTAGRGTQTVRGTTTSC